MEKPKKTYPTVGCCGLDCGLCPRYYTEGTSRCPGCAGPNFFEKHPSCSFITCCVKNKGYEVCAECSEFPCPKIKSDEEYQKVKESSSYPPYKKVPSNFHLIQKHGIRIFIEQQKVRIQFLQTLLNRFDDGRSRSFFCKAAAFLDLKELEDSIQDASRKIKAEPISDGKRKAKIVREILTDKLSHSEWGRSILAAQK